MLFLSIDFGTSAVKMAIVTENGEVKCQAKHDYPYIMLPGDKVELSPAELLNALFAGAASLDSSSLSQVEFVCYDTFSPSLVLLDKDGELAYPNIITHMDRRSRAQSSYIEQTVGRDHYMNISGIYPFPGGCSAMTLLWFLEHEPEIMKKVYRAGHLTTFIHKLFTGEWMVDMVNASMTGLYETTTQGGWSKELLECFRMNIDWFPPVVAPGIPLGTLLPSIADKLGVQAGIPVAAGTNDVASAQMGARNTKAGQIMNTAGSSEMVSILTDKPVVNPHYYLRNAALPGLWQIYATTAGGFAIDWFFRQFCRDMSRETFFSHYFVSCIDTSLQDNCVTFDPYLTGDRQSLEKKTASWHGLTLAATREQMLGAMLKSIQDVLYTAIKEASQVQELDSVIKVSGGMATPSYLKLKALSIPGFKFHVVDNCPILGNVELVKYYAK